MAPLVIFPGPGYESDGEENVKNIYHLALWVTSGDTVAKEAGKSVTDASTQWTEGKIQSVVRISESQHHGTFDDASQAHDFQKTMTKRLKTRQQHHFLSRGHHSPWHDSSKRAASVASPDPPVPLAHSEFCPQLLRLSSTEVNYSWGGCF